MRCQIAVPKKKEHHHHDHAEEPTYDKEDYLENPELYKIGINRECFTKTLFMQWVFYALWHAAIIFATVLYALNQPQACQSDGKEIGFWVAGMTIYGVCIFVANFLLAMRFNTHSCCSTLTLLAGVVAYFFFYSILAVFFTNQINHLFMPNFSIGVLWLSVLFCVLQTYVIEKIYKCIVGEINECLRSRKQKKEKVSKNTMKKNLMNHEH